MIECLEGHRLKFGDIVYDIDVREYAVTFRVCNIDMVTELLVLEYLSGPKRYTKDEDGFFRFGLYISWYKIPNTNVIGPINYIKKMEF